MVAFIGFISNLVVINNKTRGFPEGGLYIYLMGEENDKFGKTKKHGC